MTAYKNESIPLWQLQDDARIERLFLPWKRLLARFMDLVIYLLLWWTVAYFILHRNIALLHWIPCSALMFVISLACMIVLEPVLITIFGTTPGKALFGMRLRKRQGGKLSLPQSYIRLFRVLFRGCGCVIIPIYNLVRMYKACKECQIEGVSSWDAEDDIVCSCNGKFAGQIARSVVSVVIVAGLLVLVYFAADMPGNRGQITAPQLDANLERYWDFHGTGWNTELFYTVNLQFYDISAGHIFDRMDPPEVVFEKDGDIVTGVSFEFTNVSRTVLMALPTWLRGYTVSYVGAQRGMDFVKMHSPGGVIDTLLAPVNTIINRREGTENLRFIAAGMEISLDITANESISASFSIREI